MPYESMLHFCTRSSTLQLRLDYTKGKTVYDRVHRFHLLFPKCVVSVHLLKYAWHRDSGQVFSFPKYSHFWAYVQI